MPTTGNLQTLASKSTQKSVTTEQLTPNYGQNVYGMDNSVQNKAVEESAGGQRIGTTTTSSNFRRVPDSKDNTAVIRLLPKGTSFKVIAQEGAWLRIQIGDEIGYVYKTNTDQAVTKKEREDVVSAGNKAGVRGTADSTKTEIARYNPNESMFDNVTRAVGGVETAGDYRKAADIGDGAGLSVGGFQFTEASSLYNLVMKYIEIGGTVQFSETLQTRLSQAKARKNKVKLTSSERSTVQKLLHRAYDEDYDHYIQAQKLAWAENYFNPCTDRMEKYGLDPDTLDPRICVLIYDHENSGSGNNEEMLQILADRYGDGKTIDQSKLTLENVAIAIQDQFEAVIQRSIKKHRENPQKYQDKSIYRNGWNNRVMTLYAAMKLPDNSAASTQTTPTQHTPSNITSAETAANSAQTNEPETEVPETDDVPKIDDSALEKQVKDMKLAQSKLQKDASNSWGSIQYTSKYGVEVRSNSGSSKQKGTRTDYGISYQCVEFVNRFYTLALGHQNMNRTGNAKDYLGKGDRNGLETYEFGKSTAKPQAGDLLVNLNGSSGYGHVGICEYVSGNTMHVAQQNTKSSASVDHTLTQNSNGTWSCSKWHGWRRKPGAAQKLGTLAEYLKNDVPKDATASTATQPTNATPAAAATTPAAQVSASQNQTTTETTYTVKKGDSLAAIATKFNVSGGYKALAQYNNISNPNRISVGQVIKIPASSAAKPIEEQPQAQQTTATAQAQQPEQSNAGAGSDSGLVADQDLADASMKYADGRKASGLCATGVSWAFFNSHNHWTPGNGNEIGDFLMKDGKGIVWRELTGSVGIKDALKVPGVVLTWQKTNTTLGQRCGHVAVTQGDGSTTTYDGVEKNTADNESKRSGLRIFSVNSDYVGYKSPKNGYLHDAIKEK